MSVFLIQLMFSDSEAKKLFGKKWRIILLVTKFFTEYFFYWQNFMKTFFLQIRLLVNYNHVNNINDFIGKCACRKKRSIKAIANVYICQVI